MPVLDSIGSAWVEPIAPIQSTVIKCSALENLCAPVHHSLALFFRLETGHDSLRQYEYMQQGLRYALYQYTIWTGQLKADIRGAFSVVIPPAPLAGVNFRYRDLSKDPAFPTLEEFSIAGFPLADAEHDGLKQLRYEPFPASEDGNPTLVSQLTHIKGGLVLVSSFSHLVADIVQSRAFIKQWAASTKALKEASNPSCFSLPLPPQLPEVLTDTSRLSPLPTASADFPSIQHRCDDLQNFKLVNVTDPVGTLSDIKNLQTKCHIQPSLLESEEEQREPAIAVWSFSQDVLKALHSSIQKVSPQTKLSIFDILTAFLWNRHFFAKYPSNSGHASTGLYADLPKSSTIVNTIDIRRKLNPPLPDDFMGAAVDLLRVTIPSAIIIPRLQDSEGFKKSLFYIASALRQANASWCEQEYMNLLELVQKTQTSPGLILRGPVDLLITDHRGFIGFFKSDWGKGLGHCLAFREPYIGRSIPAGEIVLMPSRKKGEVEVMIAAERIVIQRLFMDQAMSRLGTCKFLVQKPLGPLESRDRIKAKL